MTDTSGLLMSGISYLLIHKAGFRAVSVLAQEADAVNTSAPWGPALPEQEECWGERAPSAGPGPVLSSGPGRPRIVVSGRKVGPGGHLEPVAPLHPILASAPLRGGTGVFVAGLRPSMLSTAETCPTNKACHQPPETWSLDFTRERGSE